MQKTNECLQKKHSITDKCKFSNWKMTNSSWKITILTFMDFIYQKLSKLQVYAWDKFKKT